jgi:hypothetical protein
MFLSPRVPSQNTDNYHDKPPFDLFQHTLPYIKFIFFHTIFTYLLLKFNSFYTYDINTT